MTTIISTILGNNPTIKVLEYLITGRGFDYSISDIAKGSGTSRTKVYEVLEKLIKQNIIVKTRKAGVSPMYKFNKDNNISKIILNLYKSLLKLI